MSAAAQSLIPMANAIGESAHRDVNKLLDDIGRTLPPEHLENVAFLMRQAWYRGWDAGFREGSV